MQDNIKNEFVHTRSGIPKTESRSCEWPSCRLKGIHRAPKSHERIQEYSWFCLEHVRVYNSSWNHYEGISNKEFDELVRSDTTWNRPTWPLGDGQRNVLKKNDSDPFGPQKNGINYKNFDDPFCLFDRETGFKGLNEQSVRSSVSVEERKALRLLGFDSLVNISELKTRYKLLVKKYHPDRTGGNKKLEERFKQISEAYEIVVARITNS